MGVLKAPVKPGDYSGVFQLADPSRTTFGDRLTYSFKVEVDQEEIAEPKIELQSDLREVKALPACLPVVTGRKEQQEQASVSSSSVSSSSSSSSISSPVERRVRELPVAIPVPVARQQPVYKYQSEVELLAQMGFVGEHVPALLNKHKGDLRLVINELLLHKFIMIIITSWKESNK